MHNCAIIAQKLLCSWLTYLYNLSRCMPQQEIVLVGQKLFSSVSVVLDIRRIIQILPFIALKHTAYVALTMHLLKGQFFEK